MTSKSVTPVGLNHLVLCVREMDESHRFWTEILGFKQVGELHPDTKVPGSPRMRFYSGNHGGGVMHHHDVALREDKRLPPADPAAPCAISHVAFALPGREAWLRQLRFLQERGVKFERRAEHGMTHSVYIRDPNGYSIELLYELPREIWGGDIDAALNHYVSVPVEGAAALEDRTEGLPVFSRV